MLRHSPPHLAGPGHSLARTHPPIRDHGWRAGAAGTRHQRWGDRAVTKGGHDRVHRWRGGFNQARCGGIASASGTRSNAGMSSKKLSIPQLKYLRAALLTRATARHHTVFFSIWAFGRTHTARALLKRGLIGPAFADRS